MNVGSSGITDVNVGEPVGTGDRLIVLAGGEISIPKSARGTTKTVRFEGAVTSEAQKGFAYVDEKSSSLIRVRFEEEAL